MVDRRLIVWSFLDGKAGHERQVTGLVAALSELRALDQFSVPLLGRIDACRVLLGAKWPQIEQLPDPDLLVVAGRRTHLTGLAARHTRGGRLIALMRPGLPMAWFDLCIVPRHDGVATSDRVMVTSGALNPVIAPGESRGSGGLILVGGPSRHFGWDDARLMVQIRAIVAAEPERRFTVADSRRTAPATSAALKALSGRNVDYVHHAATSAGWIDAQLADSSLVWVTRDSVSMIHEALSSGAAVGLIDVPARRPESRIAAAINEIESLGEIVSYRAWHSGAPMGRSRAPLREASRCAKEIVHRWFTDTQTESLH